MKTVLRCTKCDTVFPMALAQKWGHSAAADGLGPDARCPSLVDAPHAPRAVDPSTGERTIVPEELCGGQLSTESVADATPEEDIGMYGPQAVARGPIGAWRQKAKRPNPAA